MNFEHLFDEVHPESGASPIELNQLANELTLFYAQLSQNHHQTQTDFIASLHNSSYFQLLTWSNGGAFCKGQRWYDWLFATHEVLGITNAYNVPKYMPAALPFAFDGGGIFYVFDLRQPSKLQNCPIYCVSAGYLCWNADAAILVANSFDQALDGLFKISDLLFGTKDFNLTAE
jgi:hypothetical protein